MKSLAFISFSAFVLTAALPNPPVTTVTVIPIPAAASPYPSKPTTNEFSYENYDEKDAAQTADRTKIHDAFGAWAEVLQAAIQSLADTSDDTFNRWFPTEVKSDGKPYIDARTYVREAFLRVFKPDATSPTPQSRVATLINDRIDYYPACGPTTKAYFSPSDNRFHICPKGLEQATSARDLDCKKLGTQVGPDMNSLTGTLIHEFMHWDRVGKDLSRSAGESSYL